MQIQVQLEGNRDDGRSNFCVTQYILNTPVRNTTVFWTRYIYIARDPDLFVDDDALVFKFNYNL